MECSVWGSGLNNRLLKAFWCLKLMLSSLFSLPSTLTWSVRVCLGSTCVLVCHIQGSSLVHYHVVRYNSYLLPFTVAMVYASICAVGYSA